MSTTQTGFASVASSAIKGVSNYFMAQTANGRARDRAGHESRMTDLNWRHNKSMALENLKLNQYIVGINKIKLLDASAAQTLAIDIEAMNAKASAEVVQAAYGIKGGSAKQVLHNIARSAEIAESTRLNELDSALHSNRLQAFNAESRAQDVVGIRPISVAPVFTDTAALEVGNFAGRTLNTIAAFQSKEK